ncbi:MAG: glycosyltransferase [Croceibacterium sp.]
MVANPAANSPVTNIDPANGELLSRIATVQHRKPASCKGELRLRICHVIESANAGSATILQGLALHAVRRGHEVHVRYAPRRADPQIIQALCVGGCASVVPTMMRREVGVWDVSDGIALRRSLGQLGALDVIHSHSSKAGVLARTFGRFRSAAQVYSPHGFYTMTGEAPFYATHVERVLSAFTDRIIAVSEYERRHALELGIAHDRISVVPNGIAPFASLPRARAREELGFSSEDFLVGFVGRLVPQKNPVDAIEAIGLVKPGLNVRLAVIGDGILRGEAEARATASGSRATFLGTRDAKRLFSAFDVLLCTSRYEGLPVTFLEAINCGVPLISYPVGGTAEMIVEGNTGFEVEPTPVAAAKAIEKVAALTPTLRAHMALACKALAVQHTDAVMGDKTLSIYESILSRRA